MVSIIGLSRITGNFAVVSNVYIYKVYTDGRKTFAAVTLLADNGRTSACDPQRSFVVFLWLFAMQGKAAVVLLSKSLATIHAGKKS